MINIENFLAEKNIDYEYDVSAEKLSTYKGGGIVKLVISPTDHNINESLAIVRDFPHYFLGNGSNTLIDDYGFDGVVICTKNLNTIIRDNNEFTVGAGTLIPYLNAYLERLNLSGLERLSGIPASLGGACVMNAGAYGIEICEFIKEITCYDLATQRELTIGAKDIAFSYRSSGDSFKNAFIKSVKLTGFTQGYDASLSRALREKRRNSQPNKPSLGSVFKSATLPAGYLIDKCGLKGTRARCAQISPTHANFIVNNGGGSASDYLTLLAIARDTVKRKFGITLTPEIKILTNRKEIWEFTTQ